VKREELADVFYIQSLLQYRKRSPLNYFSFASGQRSEELQCVYDRGGQQVNRDRPVGRPVPGGRSRLILH